jgi:hypothetical protein
MLAMALEVVATPIVRVARRIDADMGDAELRPDPAIIVVAWPDLGPDMHDRIVPAQLARRQGKAPRCWALHPLRRWSNPGNDGRLSLQ